MAAQNFIDINASSSSFEDQRRKISITIARNRQCKIHTHILVLPMTSPEPWQHRKERSNYQSLLREMKLVFNSIIIYRSPRSQATSLSLDSWQVLIAQRKTIQPLYTLAYMHPPQPATTPYLSIHPGKKIPVTISFNTSSRPICCLTWMCSLWLSRVRALTAGVYLQHKLFGQKKISPVSRVVCRTRGALQCVPCISFTIIYRWLFFLLLLLLLLPMGMVCS